MDKMDRDRRKVEQREADIARLRAMWQQAVHSGVKLGLRDRLKAAFHLTRAWSRANKEGLKKEDFQDAILARLQRPHAKRREFRLSNWKLRRGENPATQDLTEKYKDKSTPQKSLEPYLVGITVAAEHCGADPDDWNIDMVRDLSTWSRTQISPGVAPPDDRPAETLAILLNAMCVELARRSALAETFDVVDRMSCRWEMYTERLFVTEHSSMEDLESPISPNYADTVYYEEMFPFPSVPLLRVPYACGEREFSLSVQSRPKIQELNRAHLESGLPDGKDMLASDASKIETGHLVWFREIRLCIVPDGRGNLAAALETRPFMRVEFPETSQFSGTHQIVGANDLDSLNGGIFAGDGKHFGPYIQTEDGEYWDIGYREGPRGNDSFGNWVERLPTSTDPSLVNNPGVYSTGWWFDPDPVRYPAEVDCEPWYLSYTPATAPYLRHWLTQDGRLENPKNRESMPRYVWAECPWSPHRMSELPGTSEWRKKSPPVHELNFPDRSHATWIESCLHNGRIEEALQAKIDTLQEQTARLQANWHAARARHSNALLRRWKSASNDKGIQE